MVSLAISKVGKTSNVVVVVVVVVVEPNVLLKKMIPERNRLVKHNEYLFQ